jgi:transcriptional regulator with XRE-family HTH domain
VAREPAHHLTEATEPADDLARRLGARVRERRLSQGRTLADVANEAGVSVSYLSAIELGTNVPSLPILARLVHALRLTLHELLKGEQRLHVRDGDVDPRRVGKQELHHPAMRLRVASVVAEPGERGDAPLPLGNATVFVFVERGALLVEVDGSPYALGQGDALDAVEVTDMRWQTLGELPAVSLWGASPARGG